MGTLCCRARGWISGGPHKGSVPGLPRQPAHAWGTGQWRAWRLSRAACFRSPGSEPGPCDPPEGHLRERKWRQGRPRGTHNTLARRPRSLGGADCGSGVTTKQEGLTQQELRLAAPGATHLRDADEPQHGPLWLPRRTEERGDAGLRPGLRHFQSYNRFPHSYLHRSRVGNW